MLRRKRYDVQAPSCAKEDSVDGESKLVTSGTSFAPVGNAFPRGTSAPPASPEPTYQLHTTPGLSVWLCGIGESDNRTAGPAAYARLNFPVLVHSRLTVLP